MSGPCRLPAFLDQLAHDPPSHRSAYKVDLRQKSWWRAPAAACDCIVGERWSCFCAPPVTVLALCVFVPTLATMILIVSLAQSHS